MNPVQMLLLPPMGAVILGTMLFAGLTLLGLAIIRRLRLPQDLPEGPRFEPPPPALREPSDQAAASAIARRQEALRQRLELAHGAVADGQFCQEVLAQLSAVEAGDPAQAASLAEARLAAAQAIEAGNAAEALAPRLRSHAGDEALAAPLDELAGRAGAARKRVEEACARLPEDGGNRRLLWMLLLLAVMLAWFGAMRWMLHG